MQIPCSFLTACFIVFAPLSTVAAAQTHSATLTWSDLLNPAGTTYNVYRATGLCSGTPTFSKIASAITPKTYIDSTVTPGNYCFEVTAVVNGAESVPSNTTGAPVPAAAPTGLTVNPIAQVDVKIPDEVAPQ